MHPNTSQLIPDATLDARIEALLFASGNNMKKTTLVRLLECSLDELENAIRTLSSRLTGGVALIETDGALALVTAPSVSATVAAVKKNQNEQEIGEAGLEVLSIILYREKATRASIDYIRGVNSAATIRTLTMRGLIERVPAKNGIEGETAYRVTPQLLAHLGVTHVSDIPEHATTLKELSQFEQRASSAEATPPLDETENLSYDDATT